LKRSGTISNSATDERYSTRELVSRLFALAWRFRADCVWSVVLSLIILMSGIVGLKLLGVVIDIIRQALNSTLPPQIYPFGWNPPPEWSALQIVTAIAVAIVVLAMLRAVLTYIYNMITARLTQGEIVPALRAQLYAKLQRLSFSFFDVHGSNSIFNRVTGDVQNTRLFVERIGNEKEAVELVDTMDEERRKFIKHHFGHEWPNRHFFHVMLNTALGDDLTVETILNLLNAVNQSGETGKL
jgi:ATP-binding cassette subfamily B protein